MQRIFEKTNNTVKKIIISGLSGGSGKTFVSLGLTRFYTQLGHEVCPFKKGPDYIDSAWLMQASHKPCYCLDPFFLNDGELYRHFSQTLQSQADTTKKNLAIIEGNRGLYDGKDEFGSCSTAQLAHTLDCPVLLTVNCTKITRTTAALVMGIQHFDPKLKLSGVILNNIASSRHGNIIRKSIETYTDIPILGVIPRQKANPIPERHLGLSLKDFADKESILDHLAKLVRENTDTQKILSLMAEEILPDSKETPIITLPAPKEENLHIAYLYDDAFWFYYQENFDELAKQGANLIPLSLLSEKNFNEQLKEYELTENDIHALYIGGGYPELYAETISNSPKLQAIKNWVEQDMPVYAECGGFMLLTKNLHTLENGTYKTYPMTGIFDIDTKFLPKPQGLGYTETSTIHENPFHPMGSTWKGHEFHFSTAINYQKNQDFLFRLDKGHGMIQRDINGKKTAFDGLLHKNCHASYTHLYAPAVPHFAKNFVKKAKEYQKKKFQADKKYH